METIVLPFENWSAVESIVREEFCNGMPQRRESDTFIARFDGDKLAGFVHVEHLYHFNSLYVAPEYRGQGIAAGMFLDALGCVPPGFSAVALIPENKRSTWARYVNARDLGLLHVWRKDVPYEQR